MLLAQQRDENAALRLQIAEGAGQPRAAAGGHRVAGAGGQGGAAEQIDKTCGAGHALCAQYGRISDYNNVFCDECGTTNLNDHPKFYRCAPCKYDLCVNCGEN